MTVSVCVLIRAKNEVKDIGKTLTLVAEQSMPCEIVVVDSGSTDGTVELVKQHSQVRLIEMPASEFTYGRSLNLGFAATQAEIIVPLSAHAFPCDRTWLASIIQPFENSQVAGVYGKQVAHLDAYPIVERECLDFYGSVPRLQQDPENINDREFSNANSAIRRTCWEMQPFDETLSYSEDQAWAGEMLQLGYAIVYEPKAAVYHSHNESLSQFFRRCYKEGKALQAMYSGKIRLKTALGVFWRAVKADVQFIVKRKRDLDWLIKAPIYRLCAAYALFHSQNYSETL